MHLVIISGRSGSGKTVALHALEDLGFYCIDNLPATLLPELERYMETPQERVGVSIDVRNIPEGLIQFKDIVQKLNKPGYVCNIVYLDAADNILLKRFSETRRKHPLTHLHVSLREAIQKEQQILAPISSLADLTIDTSTLSNSALHQMIRDRLASRNSNHLQVLIQSFGYKKGVPPDADFVFDVRCLPNPYWEPALRDLSGENKAVIDFLSKDPDVQKMLHDITHFLEQWIPRFSADNRSYLTVAIGCTGGLHRSVYLTNAIANRLKKNMDIVQVRHRDLAPVNIQHST
jgi:RNase adapter protein RapZ